MMDALLGTLVQKIFDIPQYKIWEKSCHPFIHFEWRPSYLEENMAWKDECKSRVNATDRIIKRKTVSVTETVPLR